MSLDLFVGRKIKKWNLVSIEKLNLNPNSVILYLCLSESLR